MTPPRRSTPAERPKRVLLVDDGPVDQRIVGHMLRSAGYTVLVASSGEEGLAVAARELPSLIVLDFMLPDIDAPEVLRRLRGSPATAEVPVILLTSTDFVGHIAQGFQAGANDYLMKPVDGRLLGERIEAALSARHPAR
jgi:DNA-binding response OmpR family regulator